MPNKKGSFIAEAVGQISTCATNYGLDIDNLDEFDEVVIKYLKQSFKNGVEVGKKKIKKQAENSED